MFETDNSLPSSKKRVADRELTKDNANLDDNRDSAEEDNGTFKRASEEVLASRKIVKVNRKKQTNTTSANPFANIKLVPAPGETKDTAAASAAEVTKEVPTSKGVGSEGMKTNAGQPEELKTEVNSQPGDLEEKSDEPEAENTAVPESKGEEKSDEPEGENTAVPESKGEEPATEAVEVKDIDSDPESGANKATENEINTEGKVEDGEASVDNGNDKSEKDASGDVKTDKAAEGSSFNSFKQLSSSQNAFSGLAGTGLSSSPFSFGTIGDNGTATDPSQQQPSFGFGLSVNGNSSLFGASGTSLVPKNEGSGFRAMQEVPVETGEENEKVVFSADSVLFEYFDGGWKERGKGEVRVNVMTTGAEKARLLMRARGNYRLILNASLFPEMKLESMDKRGITFACVNSVGDGKESLSTFALKFRDASFVEDFRAAVLGHKTSKASGALKTPENSPKADGS